MVYPAREANVVSELSVRDKRFSGSVPRHVIDRLKAAAVGPEPVGAIEAFVQACEGKPYFGEVVIRATLLLGTQLPQ